MSTHAVIIITTCPNQKESAAVTKALMDQKLAACVQTSPITSTYLWKGTIETSSELRLLIKTTDALFDAVAECIKKVSSYENPEILCIPVTKGSADYLKWISDETSSV